MNASRQWSADAGVGRAAVVCAELLASVACILPMGAMAGLAHAGPAYSTAATENTAALAADFGRSTPGTDTRHLADWIARTKDNQGKTFFLVDKVHATLYVFDHIARLQASTPVLLGATLGDDSVPGIGTRPMAHILHTERTTPAGRFIAEGGRNLQGEDIVWVDHEAAVSMHRVRNNNPMERRVERLRTPTANDNRISYGCINVPAVFYDQHVRPAFSERRSAIVYVLPETRSLLDQFGMHLTPPAGAALSP